MPNSERVLNRKVQVLIKIAPPYFDFYYKKLQELLEGECTTLSGPPGGLNGKINSHYINHNIE